MLFIAFVFFLASVAALTLPGTRWMGLLGLVLLAWVYPVTALLLLVLAGVAFYFYRRYQRRLARERLERLD